MTAPLPHAVSAAFTAFPNRPREGASELPYAAAFPDAPSGKRNAGMHRPAGAKAPQASYVTNFPLISAKN